MNTAQQWEYRRLLLGAPTDPHMHEEGGATYLYYGKREPEIALWKDDEVAELGQNGWEMVAAVPIMGGLVKQAPSNNWSVGYVIGYVLWFKRPQA